MIEDTKSDTQATSSQADNGDDDTERQELLAAYRIEDQTGFVLRKVTQRHTAIFAELIPDELTPTQFATLAKLFEIGECSQNRLGRLTAMDAATIKGVVDRLVARDLLHTWPDPEDRRRLQVKLTEAGDLLARRGIKAGLEITQQTLKPLTATERRSLLRILRKIT